ncbi:MAG: glycosyltransferase family 4 protein [Alphaproteobacteria bacterium]|nr:glycosyltransferase family 4 protein [Alphaproteobacteria bacterium]
MPSLKQIALPAARRALAGGYSWARRLGLYHPNAAPIHYIAEKTDWVIRQDAIAYQNAIERRHPGAVVVTDRPERATGRIAHFASQFIWQAWAPALDKDTRCLITYFHGKPEDGPEMARHVAFFLDHLNRLERIVTAASRIEARLLEWGVPREKLVRVPLGVDFQKFRPPSSDERREFRANFGIPEASLCIGSFQKDGEGWGDGMVPKLIKGPDLFVETVGRLARHFPVFVFLTGPARGYVKRGLEAINVPYVHHNLPQADMVADAFRALDLYIVASREEGGPKAVLESLASGVPLVTTRVGMAQDVVEDGVNGFLVDKPDAGLLADRAAALLSQPELASRHVERGLLDIRRFAWDIVAEQLYDRAYRGLLER